MSLDNSISMTYGTASLVVAILCLATPQLTIAEDSNDLHPNLESGFSLDLGLFYPDRQLDLRVNGSFIGINDEIHFDEEVQLDRADNIFAAELAWRYHGKWSVIGQYFKSDDTTRAVLEEDIEWGDVVFGAGSNSTFSRHHATS